MMTDQKRKSNPREPSSAGHLRVDHLPRLPENQVSYWLDSPNGRSEYTHQLFRFPAKFHPPVVRWALGNYGRKGSTVVDPFNGSGTVQVEALVRGISSVGVDIDPLACLIAQAKTTPIDPGELRIAFDKVKAILKAHLDSHSDREAIGGADISEQRFLKESENLDIPEILNITHWFRRYVIIDLARILSAIGQAKLGEPERRFLRACVAAIIRRVSNADPDPVSGLEVTSIQAERNKTRKIKVFSEFFNKVEQSIQGMDRLWESYRSTGARAKAYTLAGDATALPEILKDSPIGRDGVPLVITSPPYCRAVEYSRRHQLEMYWLDIVQTPAEHITLTHKYIGRKLVRVNDWKEDTNLGISKLDRTLQLIDNCDPHRGRSVRHYFSSMARVFKAVSIAMKTTGTLVCVIGDSECCGIRVTTSDFIAEVASEHFELQKRFSYALRNHYMQYGLWNGEGIKQEHVLVMKPR